MVTIITILTAVFKAIIDAYRWPFDNHIIGFLVVALVIFIICWIDCEIYHIFLYNVVFNPSINLITGRNIFYIGDTAWTDKTLKRYFGNQAGQVWIGSNVVLLILTI